MSVIQIGSSVTGLMVYPDIDFTVQHEKPDVQEAIRLTPLIFSQLNATALKIADFRSVEEEEAGYYIGFEIPYKNKSWHIDATVTRPGPITTNPTELSDWIDNISEDQRKLILELKKELIETRRYAGSRSKPPYTFRSSHLYEAVLRGGASSVAEVEAYYR